MLKMVFESHFHMAFKRHFQRLKSVKRRFSAFEISTALHLDLKYHKIFTGLVNVLNFGQITIILAKFP